MRIFDFLRLMRQQLTSSRVALALLSLVLFVFPAGCDDPPAAAPDTIVDRGDVTIAADSSTTSDVDSALDVSDVGPADITVEDTGPTADANDEDIAREPPPVAEESVWTEADEAELDIEEFGEMPPSMWEGLGQVSYNLSADYGLSNGGTSKAALRTRLRNLVSFRKPITVFAEAPNNAWIVMSDSERWVSDETWFADSGLKAELDSIAAANLSVRSIVFATNGAFLISTGRYFITRDTAAFNAFKDANGVGMLTRLQTIARTSPVRVLAMFRTGAWVAVDEAGDVHFDRPRLASGLADELDDFVRTGRTIEGVAIRSSRWAVWGDGEARLSNSESRLDVEIQDMQAGGLGPTTIVLGWASDFFVAATRRLASSSLSRNLDDIEQCVAMVDGKCVSIWELMDRHQITGTNIALVRDGQILFRRGYGKIKRGRVSGVRTTDPFPAASMSKAVASAVLVALHERGIVDIDRPVLDAYTRLELHPVTKRPVSNAGQDLLSRWLRVMNCSWSDAECERWNDSFAWYYNFTPRQLLRHMGGMDRHGIGSYDVAQNYDLEDVLLGTPGNSPFTKVQRAYAINSEFSYSGGGYSVVEAWLQKMTGKDLATWAEELLFTRARWNTMTFGRPADEGRLAWGTLTGRYDANGIAADFTAWPTQRACPGKAAGGLIASSEDMARFAVMLASGGLAQSETSATRLLKTDSVLAMMTPTIFRPSRPQNWACPANGVCADAGFGCEHTTGTVAGGSKSCVRHPVNRESSNRSARIYGLGVEFGFSLDKRGTADGADDVRIMPSRLVRGAYWPRAFFHGGAHDGIRNLFGGNPEKRVGWAIMTNSHKCTMEDAAKDCSAGGSLFNDTIQNTLGQIISGLPN